MGNVITNIDSQILNNTQYFVTLASAIKGEDIPTALEVTARRPGRETNERRQLRDSANTPANKAAASKAKGI